MWKMRDFVWTFISFFCLFNGVILQEVDDYFTTTTATSLKGWTEHSGGRIINDNLIFNRNKSPYWLRNDIIIEKNAKLIIEPGVVIRIEPQVGITVRGTLTAVGTEDERITLTTAEETSAKTLDLPDIRLVDGPTILGGRLQLRHNGQWRSVCTNSKNWTIADMETACRQLGFQGGHFYNWYNRQMPSKPRILYEEPQCLGTESSLYDCEWSKRQIGSGVCDYHPDLGIECLPRHDQPLPYWHGIRFEYAEYRKRLSLEDTLYIPESLSELNFINIQYAGAGRDQNTTSAIHIEGIPPTMSNLQITNSAYNGINITEPNGPIRIKHCTIRYNRGHGIFINSSFGLSYLDDCVIQQNGGDGVRYVHAEERPDQRTDRFGYNDFCNLAISSSQTFPLQLFAEQSIFLNLNKYCDKVFTTKPGHVLTLQFVRAVTDRNFSATLEIHDGSTLNHRLLTTIPIRNNTRPETVTTISNRMFIKFNAEPRTNLVIFFRLLSGYSKTYDLNVTNSEISENIGRGIAIDNLRSQIHLHNSSISKNQHVAGLHITSGVGQINITESRISFNQGDGINITYTGGDRNISKTSISSNQGYGIAVWLNNTKETEFMFINQTTTVQYTNIYKNLDIGVLHGNYCGRALINITGNSFKNSLNDALVLESCWRRTHDLQQLQIGYNEFINNNRISLRITPVLNMKGRIEYNHFRQGVYGGILLKNQPLEEFNVLKNDLVVIQNYFLNNSGSFVVNLALSPYSKQQSLLFTRNFVKNNKIAGDFLKMNPRSRVSAPLVIGSNNVAVYRNIIENPDSQYEIGSHFEDQSKTINCTYNWWGYSTDEFIYPRLFHRYDRYNLAKINFLPFLIHNSNPLTNRINTNQLYVPKFVNSNRIGGEVEGEEVLTRGDYLVEKDINIRPGGKLTIEPGVILRFPPSVGVMVGGKLEARGIEPDSILFTLKEDMPHSPDNETYEIETEKNYEIETELIEIDSKIPIRLLGGVKETEGRLQVKIGNQWGTICDYNWNLINAALVCQQLGFVLNPDDWRLEPNEIPLAGTQEEILLTNVQCDAYDTDITQCRAEKLGDFENSCTHTNDVGMRCYQTSWAGLRFSPLSERSNIQFITIEKAGLLDSSTNTFKAALQIDFARHNFENIKIINNFYDGLGVLYADLYTDDTVNVVKNSEFSNNKGAGISLKQLTFNIYGSLIENNFIGIKHDPIITNLQQREYAGWFLTNEDNYHYQPFTIPYDSDNNIIHIQRGETKYFITTEIQGGAGGDNVLRSYKIRTDPGWVIGIQLLNPIQNRSTETIVIHDSITLNQESDVWHLKRDLSSFPTTSTTHGIIVNYNSGNYSVGGTVIVISTIRAPVQNIYNRIVKGPVPTVLLKNTKIRHNQYGFFNSYYNRYLDELNNHFLRKSNETFKLLNCEISHNINEAIFTHSPNWDLHASNLSEITIMINNTLITDNGRGVYQFSRDMRSSNNLFHYILQDVTIERNKGGGFQVHLPYVWKYNENYTHSIYIDNNTLINNKRFAFIIDGHFAVINITNTRFLDNNCLNGLLSIRGMEKKLLIRNNQFLRNFGKFIVEFSTNSQSEIIGDIPAWFIFNELTSNKYAFKEYNIEQIYNQPTSVIIFNGIQKVLINRNLFADNQLDYQLIAGIKTAKINNYLNVRENWWGTDQEQQIRQQIFDFDDWNNYAIADYHPFLLNNDYESSYSVTFQQSNQTIDLNNLGGRVNVDLTLPYRTQPYLIQSDITIMPSVTLTIYPGVVLEFGANVGILVLGHLKAQGYQGNEIIMRPITQQQQQQHRDKRQLENLMIMEQSIRLCQGGGCTNDGDGDGDKQQLRQGFLEYFNKTTLQWIPMCDSRFTERNAQVVCRELGFDSLNVFFDYDKRVEFHSNSLSRIWSWPEPLQCRGNEKKYEDCPIRLNGQQYGHRHECKWNDPFIFINCGRRNMDRNLDYWGGIRFTDAEFEQQIDSNRYHDPNTHMTIMSEESVLEFVRIEGAGILHNEKSPAIQAIVKSPKINYVEITKSASHGINLISPSNTMVLLGNKIDNSLGVGINVLTLTGEGKESNESSFTPLKNLNIPYNLFSLVDICDTHKEIRVEERILLYYKYDNHPVNCIKIFRSSYNIKKLGFRLLQFNLFNSTNNYGIPDFISLYDGDIYNVSSKLISRITTQAHNEKHMFRTTTLPSLSVKLFANGASSNHGFIAEIVTLPISAVGFNRDVQHNISYSVVNKNREGAILYMTAGEVNPIVTIDKNQFRYNGEKLYGNFTTCQAAVNIDVQNTRTIYFRNNLVEANQGGLSIKADSSGSPTSLDAYLQNNLFVNNLNLPVVYVEGRKSTPYQRVYVYRNYITRNYAKYYNNIILKQVISDFAFNYVKRNVGLQNLEISGFDNVRLRFYQTTTHNGFYHNYAVHRDSRSTIVAGTAGQQYLDNIFFNPDNDYEMITVNRSLFEFNSTFAMWNTKIDAANNYWGLNTSLAVSGRIRDQSDDPRLLEVVYMPYYMNNQSVLLNKKCPPGWDLVGDTCYIYIGAPMTFNDARAFCQADNASMPYLVGSLNYIEVYNFLKSQKEWFLYSDRVWVQHIDKINECTMFAYQRVEIDDCNRLSPFICEIDPKVSITILPLADDTVTIATIASVALALILIGIIVVFWWTKSKYRQAQRLERRNSIRQSLHSLRSVGLAPSTFSDASYRRKAAQLSSRSTDTLTKNSDYKKMITNGSLDSMEKSTYESSIDDNQSYDIYEAHNPHQSSVFTYSPTIEYHKSPNHRFTDHQLAYKNEGFRDNSTFASNSRADSVQDSTNEEVPIIDGTTNINSISYPPSEYYNTDTLPIGGGGPSDSTLKRGADETNKNRNYDPSYSRERPNNNNLLQELKRKLPRNDLIELPPAPEPPQSVQSPTYSEKLNTFQYSPDYSLTTTPTTGSGGGGDRPQSVNLLETDFDEPHPRPKVRAKSEVLLETNFDFIPQDNQHLSDASRSKSQPLETAM